MVFWFTGQPGAGKTVLGSMLRGYIESRDNKKVFQIDGDELRSLFSNQKYGREGREENIKRAQDIAKYINHCGYDVIVSLVAPYIDLRESFKSMLGDDIIEIYVHTEEIRGRESFHVVDYEKPNENFIDIDTTGVKPEESLKIIINKIWGGIE